MSTDTKQKLSIAALLIGAVLLALWMRRRTLIVEHEGATLPPLPGLPALESEAFSPRVIAPIEVSLSPIEMSSLNYEPTAMAMIQAPKNTFSLFSLSTPTPPALTAPSSPANWTYEMAAPKTNRALTHPPMLVPVVPGLHKRNATRELLSVLQDCSCDSNA